MFFSTILSIKFIFKKYCTSVNITDFSQICHNVKRWISIQGMAVVLIAPCKYAIAMVTFWYKGVKNVRAGFTALYIEAVPMLQHVFYLLLHNGPYSQCHTYIHWLYPPALFTLNMKTARCAKTKEAQTYADELQQPEDTYWHRSQEVYNIKVILRAT